MQTFTRKTSIWVTAVMLLTLTLLTGCGSKDGLDSGNPVTLTMWHVFGSQTESPMNDMVDEFNKTVGKEKGIVISVTSVSNSSDIHDALLASAGGEAGAGSLPDLFFCYPETAKTIGADRLVNWSELFTEKELNEYIPAFLEEGTADGKLLVFPVAKSSEALFVNTTIFDRFAADTGAAYGDLATWKGVLETGEKYYEWSDGKTFFMHDELLNFCQINTRALGGQAFDGDKLNFADPVFKAQWDALAEAAILGSLRVEDNYETVCMMTGDIVAGVGSTASIMYFQDTVTYPDNTTEPLALKALPCPVTDGGTEMAMQQGAGLSAVNGDAKKEAAALAFAKWITSGETNLRFVTASGYMPVKNDAFAAIEDFAFETESYRSLYSAIKTMRDSYQFYLPPVVDGYYDILWAFYDGSIAVLNDCRDKYKNGEGALDVLVAESYTAIQREVEK
jgi:multiple sugar transport system substrate-binding protein